MPTLSHFKVHRKYDKAVLLLRSPNDTFMAEINRLYNDKDKDHTGHANPRIYKGEITGHVKPKVDQNEQLKSILY